MKLNSKFKPKNQKGGFSLFESITPKSLDYSFNQHVVYKNRFLYLCLIIYVDKRKIDLHRELTMKFTNSLG